MPLFARAAVSRCCLRLPSLIKQQKAADGDADAITYYYRASVGRHSYIKKQAQVDKPSKGRGEKLKSHYTQQQANK